MEEQQNELWVMKESRDQLARDKLGLEDDLKAIKRNVVKLTSAAEALQRDLDDKNNAGELRQQTDEVWKVVKTRSFQLLCLCLAVKNE